MMKSENSGKETMIRTFEFVFRLQRNKKDRQKILSIMNSNLDTEIDYGGWHLNFDAKRGWVQITDNGTDKSLSIKFVPAEISYKSLASVINKEDTQNVEFRYL